MFYIRINKIKVFNNREGFLGLFNCAEMQIYSHAAGYFVEEVPTVPPVPTVSIVPPPLTLTDLITLDKPDRQFTPPERTVSVEQLAPDRYRYTVYRQFRAYDTLEDSLADHLSLLKGPLYSAAWPHRHDPREYARRIAGTYATSPDYAKTLVVVIDKMEKTVANLEL
ncbi:MAG: hypothetical protein LBL07_03585 [Tannerella sp.]|jgi:hypothetical protein|nr:hypothetical protein [Tannerella sp.]